MVPKSFQPRRFVRYQWLRLIRVQGDPYVLARGVSIGAFVGMTPTIPFHTVMILFLTPLLRGNLVTALCASLLVSNPLTIPVQYYLSWWIGSLLFPGQASWEIVRVLMSELLHTGLFGGLHVWASFGSGIVVPLLAGGLAVAAPVAIGGYFLALYLYFLRQRRRMKALLSQYSALEGSSKGDSRRQ